jgi:hypothetical protein
MVASNAGSVAILKRKYPKGKLPKGQFTMFPAIATIEKDESFNGDDKAIVLQTENTVGFGTSIPNAQTNEGQGNYVRFLLTRVEYFSIARIKGQALRTATLKGDGAVVDLWDNETTSATQAELKQMEIMLFGTGNGVLGTIASGNTTPTITLTTPTDINNFSLNQRISLVSDLTLSPTVRAPSGTASQQVITALDRSAGTITLSTNFNTAFTGAVNGDSIVNNGDAAAGGVAACPTGWGSWLVGGSTPGTLFSLPRNPDPVRMSGQVLDCTGLNMQDGVIEAESLVSGQGQLVKKRLYCHPRDLAQLKKTLNSKVAYPRETTKGQVSGSVAGVSFRTVQIEGDEDTIDVLPSPLCPRQKAFLIDPKMAAIQSAGAAPMLLDFDSLAYLRLSGDDAYEVRFGLYGNYSLIPFSSIRLINWGV